MCIILLQQFFQNCSWTGLDAWVDILYTPNDSIVILNTFNKCKCVCVCVCVCVCDVFCGIHNSVLSDEIQEYANKLTTLQSKFSQLQH